jgi:signal transduction histidine kinase
VNAELNKLAANMNQCFKAEETLRLNGIREEKKFREMIADISHDLRTPLTAIKGYQQLLEAGELNQDQQQKLRIANKHATELGQLIEHFFEYSYLLGSQMELHPEVFNLTKLVAECLVASITIFEEKNFTVCYEEDTPPVYLSADKEMVTRIVQNLIRNCTQHSDGDLRVQIIVQKDVILSFSNPVKKSADIDVSKIFDRFYTGDKARSHSTGLGLSIVKLLAQQMGGSAMASLQDNILDIRVTLTSLNYNN